MRSISVATIGLLFLLVHTAAAQDRFQAMGIGYVVDEQDRPVADVEVRGLWTPAYRSPFPPSLVVVRTDNEGKFFVPLPAGDVSGIELLASDKNGLASYIERDVPSADKLPLEPVKLILTQTRSYSTRVLSQQGKPLAGVNVSSMPRFLGDFTKQTDEDGEAVVIVPGHWKSASILAWNRELGMDYVHINGKYGKDKDKLDRDFSGVINLKLHPWTKRTVRVVDLDRNPLADATVILQTFWLTDHRSPFYDTVLWAVYTNEEGIAEIVFPKSSHFLNVDVGKSGYYGKRISLQDMVQNNEVMLPSLMTISGKVTSPNRQSIEQVWVRVHGCGPTVDWYQESASTDAKGRFQVEVPGDSYCLINAKSDGFASVVEKRVVRRGEKPEGLNLMLQPMVRVTGVGVDRIGDPIEEEDVTFRLLDGDDGKYFEHLPDEEKLPEPPGSRKDFRRVFWHRTKTDDLGRFEVMLPIGQFEGSLGFNGKKQPFTVEPDKPLQLTLKNENLPKRILKGHVVAVEQPKKGVEGVYVSIVAVTPDTRRTTKLTYRAGHKTKVNGHFQFEVEDSAYVLKANSPDGKLIGFQFVPAGKLEATLKLGPTVSIQGKLLDADGKPVTKNIISAHIELELGPDVFCPFGQQSGRLDEEGRFVIEKLIPGQKYNMRIWRGRTPDGKSSLIEDIFSYTPKADDDKKDVGTFKLKPLEAVKH